MFQMSETSETSREICLRKSVSDKSILSLADFPASPFPLQEKEKGNPMTDFCGLNFQGSSEKLNLFGSLLKTFLDSSVLRLTTYCPIWKVKTTKQGRSYIRLQLSARRTKEKDCSSSESGKMWRTPDAHCDRRPSSKERMRLKKAKGLPISLNDQVAHCGQLLHAEITKEPTQDRG